MKRLPRKLKRALKMAFLKQSGQWGWRTRDYTIREVSRLPRFLRPGRRIIKAKGYAVTSDTLGRRTSIKKF